MDQRFSVSSLFFSKESTLKKEKKKAKEKEEKKGKKKDLDEVCPFKKRIPVALGTATAGVVDPRRRGKDKTESHLSSKPLLTTIEHAYMQVVASFFLTFFESYLRMLIRKVRIRRAFFVEELGAAPHVEAKAAGSPMARTLATKRARKARLHAP